MALNPGDRVKWAYPDTNISEAEMHGKITGIKSIIYMVRWDSGTEEECEEDDLIKEEE